MSDVKLANTTRRLVLLPSTPVWREGSALAFDRKFYDGMLEYLEYWQGPVLCIVTASTAQRPAFGMVTIDPKQAPFETVVVASMCDVGAGHFSATDVVLAAGDQLDQMHIADLCRNLHIPCVYVIEYTPEIRYRIAELSTKNPFVRARRKLYVWNGERQRRRAFRLAAGLQCNGVPAFDEYDTANNRLLYFDTRVRSQDFIDEALFEARLRALRSGAPLRLAFSGRLVTEKGVDHLPRLAEALRARGCPFELVIYGSGDLQERLEQDLIRLELSDVVRMPGAVDFYTELLPALCESVDLFVCLHRQSDPSCTYLETLSCGVPIVGYENRAFSGLLRQVDIGWLARMDDVDEVANVICRLNERRDEIATKSEAARCFSRSHGFEATFQARVEHLRACAEATSRPPVPRPGARSARTIRPRLARAT